MEASLQSLVGVSLTAGQPSVGTAAALLGLEPKFFRGQSLQTTADLRVSAALRQALLHKLTPARPTITEPSRFQTCWPAQ